MRILSRAIVLPLFLSAYQALHAQLPCDTMWINAALLRAGKMLDAGQFQPSIDSSISLLNNMKDCPDDVLRHQVLQQTVVCFRTASADFVYRGQFNNSINMLERCIALCRQTPGNNADLLAKAYSDLSGTYGLNHNEKLAAETAGKALEIRKSVNPDDPKLSANYQEIIGDLLILKDSVAMLAYLREWESLHLRLGKKASAQSRLNIANSWAFYYDLKGDIKQAIRVLEDTLNQYGEQVRAKGGFVGPSEFRLAKAYADIEVFDKSLYYAEKNVSLFETRLKQQQGKLFGRTHYAWCLAYSARAAWGLYQQTRDTSWFQLADRRCTQAEDLVFAMRDRSPSDGFREWMLDNDILGNMTEARQGMYAVTGEKRFIERNFEANEAVKTFTIQQFLHETYALQWGGIPDSLYKQETAFREKVNDLETNFFMVRLKPKADSLIAANDRELFDLRDKYSVFLANLEKSYPEYFRLKYSQPATSLSQVQTQLLRSGQCLLDLYLKNDQVYALLVRPDTILWVATRCDSAALQALDVLKSESQHFAEYQLLPEKEYLERLQTFADASYRAYQVLFAPVKPMLLEEVLLIPRNELVTLPFGTLLPKQETNMAKPFLWHFIEKEFVLSQAFSVGLFQFIQNRPVALKPTNSVLAIAPFFEEKVSSDLLLPAGDVASLTRNEVFNPLPNSGAEAQVIAKLSGGMALVGRNATKSNFLKKSPNYKMLHLATHSATNDILGEYSFVAMYSETTPNKMDMLYARDIYGLHLSADLVVLSACQTALGQYRNGEGIVGLTRAFTCAGARNVVASLWSVNDASTKTLMILFYKEIGKGVPYNRALANAKRTFIQENRQYAHPYYWAGFMLNGR